MRDVVITLSEAVEMTPDGASLMIGGFLGVGSPDRIIAELGRAEALASRCSRSWDAGA